MFLMNEVPLYVHSDVGQGKAVQMKVVGTDAS